MKKRLIYALVAFSIATASVNAQVTIGKKEKPVKGALLQLKNKDEATPGGANADKGLMLPRVQLQAIDKLSPILPVGYNASEEPKYAGMMVFNTGDATRELCKGVYVWTLDGWSRIPEPCFATGVYPGTLTFYKSALLAKNITVESTFPGTVSFVDDALAAINWKTGGFPTTTPITGNTTFSFQPNPNPGADKNATVQIGINTSGGVENKSVNIIHLDREMEFTSPTGAYPALGATHSLAIKSEAPWSAAISATNPATMVTALTDNSQPEGDTNMKVTLANNDTWAERIAKLNITSSNGDFLPRTMDVKQLAPTPAITFTSPAPDVNGDIEIDITGYTAANPAKVYFTTNANWYYEQDNTGIANTVDWQNLYGSAVPALAATQSGGPGTQITNHIIEFVQATQGNENAAGTVLKTNHKINSTSHGTATPVVKNMMVKRTVPAHHDSFVVTPGWGTDIMPKGEKITLSMNTNAWWKAYWAVDATAETPASSGGSTELAASYYGPKTLEVTIPSFPHWDTKRLVDIRLTGDNITHNTASRYWQLGYNLSYDPTDTRSTLPGAAGSGGVLKVQQDGAWFTMAMKTESASPNFSITTTNQSVSHGPWLWSDRINGATGWDDPETALNVEAAGRSVYIPSNNSWSERSVGVHHTKPGLLGWVHVGNVIQKAWTIKLEKYNTPGEGENSETEIPQKGKTYNFQFKTETSAPEFTLTATDGNGVWIPNPVIKIDINNATGTKTVPLEIPANDTWFSRDMTFHYNHGWWPSLAENDPDNDNWVAFAKASQPGYSLEMRSPNTNISISGVVEAAEANYYAYLHSSTSTPNFRIKVEYSDGSSETLPDTRDNSVDTNGNCDAIFTISANPTTTNRTIRVYYEIVDSKGKILGWRDIGSYTQLEQPWVESGDWYVHPTKVYVSNALDVTLRVAGQEIANDACSKAYSVGDEKWYAIFDRTEYGNDNGTALVKSYYSPASTYANKELIKTFHDANAIGVRINHTNFRTINGDARWVAGLNFANGSFTECKNQQVAQNKDCFAKKDVYVICAKPKP